MKTKPTWVIFDVGQVLYDYKSFMKKASIHLDVELPILRDILSEIIENSLRGEMTFEQVWRSALKQVQKEHEFEKIEKIWWDKNTFLVDTKLLVRQLFDAGYNIALFSNNWPGMKERILKNVSEKDIIKHFFESSVEKLRKPDVKFYYLVEKRTGAKKKEIYFIDDKQINLETAKNLGWQTFLYEIKDDNGITSNNAIRKQLL